MMASTRDGGNAAPSIGSRSQSGGLRKKLLRSFLSLTAFGLLVLFASGVAIFWLRASVNRLAVQRTPAVEAALIARTGIQRSLAGLRGWVTLGDPKFKEERRAAWSEEIQPAISKLEGLSQEWTDAADQQRLAELRRLLAELKESQWWAEDVARTDGNERAQVVLAQEVQPIARTLLSAVSAMIDLGVPERTATGGGITLTEMARLQIARMSSDHMLETFVVHGEGWSEIGFRQNLEVASRALEQIASNAEVLGEEQRLQLAIVEREFPWYARFAQDAVAARKSKDWNAAQYLMTTETVPLSEQVMELLNALSTNQIGLMRRETDYVDFVGNSAVVVSFGLIVGMAVVAGLMSSYRARQITQPLASLSEATRELAAGRLRSDLPVTTDDELGSLTQSFNHMRVALQKSEAALKESYESLAIEHDRAESLLLNILPSPIAERLKKSRDVIADGFPDATVLFADLVGFTEFSGRIPPAELVLTLNEIFSRFDTLAETLGLEKIKTIGDAYMVAGGLPTPRDDHAEAMADMALGMQDEIASLNAERSTSFQMRVGMNSGPVVAGVIGLKKFIYDVWGDTVNIASRMESHGMEGSIQVSEECYRRLRGRYVFEERGTIQVKGKGEMRTYILKGRAPGHTTNRRERA